MAGQNSDNPGHDPGDSVPPGVAPRDPAPLTGEDRAVKRKLEELGHKAGQEPGKGQPQGRTETTGPEDRED
ncbi:hypothetical protein [Roseomonas sp. WA12]